MSSNFSFKSWPFPTGNEDHHILKCSHYGLIAYSQNNNVMVYFEEFGHFTPLYMWTPFQHQITALEWYDASCTMSTAVPVLVVASESGRLEIFDCRSRSSIFRMHVNLSPSGTVLPYPDSAIMSQFLANSKRENDYVTAIAWSQFSSKSFLVGTKNGRLLRIEIVIGQIVKCKIEWELFFNFQIDFICIEKQFGQACAIASKMGMIATIENINKYENGKPPVASPNVVSLSNKTDAIRQIEFYPTSADFLILVTTSNSLIYSIKDCCTAPLLMLNGIRKYHLLRNNENMSLVVRDDSVEIWDFVENQFKRIADLNMALSPKYSNLKEILASDMIEDKLILLTSEMWLTTVEFKSKKLFITHRVKLLDSKPLSFSYANESLIFATEKGNVLVSETLNSNFITQMQIERKPSQQLKMDQSKSSNDFKKDDIDIKPSPLIENSEYSQNSTFSSDSSNAPLLNSVNSVNNEFRRKLSVSKSQDIKLFNEDQNADQTSKKESNKKNRVRKNIIKSCASSSSLLIDSIEESSPAEEEILDKSIVYHKQQHPLDISNIVNIPKIMKNVNRKRRFSLDTSDNVTATSFLSSLANERIQAMPKDSSSVKPQSPKPIKSGNKEQESKNVPPSSIQPENPITQSSPLLATENIQKNSKEEDKHQQTSTRIIQKNEFGNSCSIMWNYQIVKNTRIEHIEWIASTRIFVYTLAKQVIKNDDEKEKSSRRNSISSIDNSDMSQRYSGISFLYLIDLKYHRISRLFEKAGFNITAVAFSPNKQYFFVVINGFMAVLFKNDIQPKQIRSFTFQKKIFVTFAPNSLVIIGVGGEMVFITMPEKEGNIKETKKQLKLSKEYGIITCICCIKNLIYMGTTNGHILCLNLTKLKAAEIHQMKGSIVSLKAGPSGSFLAEDNKQRAIVISSDGEITKLPANLEEAILITPTILLVRKEKRPAIDVYQTIGRYSPSYPKAAYRCPLMMPVNRWIQSLIKEDQIDQNVLINYGLPNIANLSLARKLPNLTFKRISFLRNLIMNTPELWKMSYRLSIFLNDFKNAHNIMIKNTNKSIANENWAINIMKSVLFNNSKSPSENNVEGVLFAATNLFQYGFIDDAVDILLSTGLWIDAVNLLLKYEKWEYAALITRVYSNEKTLDVVKNVTSQLFKIPNLIPYALQILCEIGLENAAIDELENIEQFYSAYILRMIKDNESLNQ